MSARTIKLCIRVFERLESLAGVDNLVGQLDDAFGTLHTLATVAGLEMLCSRTSCPKNKKLEGELVLWSLELWVQEVNLGRVNPNSSKEVLASCINRFLLKRRLVNYIAAKVKQPDVKDVVYEPNRSPSTVLHAIFTSMRAFRESGCSQATSAAPMTMPWLAALPQPLDHSG